MNLKKNLIQISLVPILVISLSGCHHAVPGAFSTPKQTPIIAATGASEGAIIAGATGGAIPAGAVVGGVVGGTIGMIEDSPSSLLKKISAQGVQVVGVGQSLKLILLTDNCFDFGTINLTRSCYDVLDNIAALLKLYGNAAVTVNGYTDDGFGERFAHRLSQQEADAVVTYFWAHGIPYQRLTAKGHGNADPIASNYTLRGQKLNRRVEIIIG